MHKIVLVFDCALSTSCTSLTMHKMPYLCILPNSRREKSAHKGRIFQTDTACPLVCFASLMWSICFSPISNNFFLVQRIHQEFPYMHLYKQISRFHKLSLLYVSCYFSFSHQLKYSLIFFLYSFCFLHTCFMWQISHFTV